MRKTNIFWKLVMSLAVLASIAFGQLSDVSAQKEGPVGIVVDYIPGQSIIIMDQNGEHSEFILDPSLKILPPGSADSLAAGSFITVISPASLDKGKQIAVGIVIHPEIPDGWKGKVLAPTTAPLIKEIVIATPTGTLMTETVTVTATETPPGAATAKASLAETATPAAKTPDGETTVTADAFIKWLRSLLQQVLSSG